jgi:hypothetical protein
MSAPPKKRPAKKSASPAVVSKPGALAAVIRQMIEVARHQVAQAVNAGLTLLHWQIGSRIHREILGAKRADYGDEIVSTLSRQIGVRASGRTSSRTSGRSMASKIVATLSRQLVPEFGRGFGTRNLFRMVADMDKELAALEQRLARRPAPSSRG